MKTQYTAPAMELPLELSESNTQTHYLIYDHRGRELARQLSKKDAAYIVKCVNSHETLLKALHEALESVHHHVDEYPNDKHDTYICHSDCNACRLNKVYEGVSND